MSKGRHLRLLVYMEAASTKINRWAHSTGARLPVFCPATNPARRHGHEREDAPGAHARPRASLGPRSSLKGFSRTAQSDTGLLCFHEPRRRDNLRELAELTKPVMSLSAFAL